MGPQVSAPPAAGARPRPPIDPRLRARRIAVRRNEGRRRLRRLLWMLGAIVLAAGGWGLTRSPLLDVDEIVVDGAVHTDAGAVVAASGIERGHAMLDVDATVAEAGVLGLPWVATAEVAREWPGTVSIVITERIAVAGVPGTGGEWAVVDVTGRVLELVAEAPDRLPLVRGLPLGGSPASTLDGEPDGALQLAALLHRVVDRAGTEVLVGEDEMVVLVPAGEGPEGGVLPGFSVRIGPPTELDAKVTAVVTLIEQADLTGVEVVDVRVPSAPVLTRENGSG